MCTISILRTPRFFELLHTDVTDQIRVVKMQKVPQLIKVGQHMTVSTAFAIVTGTPITINNKREVVVAAMV